MDQDTRTLNIGAIRQLLLAAFTYEELRRFCQDRPPFNPILIRFSPHYGLDDLVAEVIDYCQTRVLLEELLAAVAEANPGQYQRFEPDLYSPDAAPDLPAEEAPPPPAPAPAAPPGPPTITLSAPIHLELVRVSAGPFAMGSDPGDRKRPDENEQPRHEVHLDEFYVSKYAVTNAQYAVFVRATGHRAPKHWKRGQSPSDRADHPVVNVSWYDTRAFCQWLSRETGRTLDLPTEAQWEKAARGTDGRLYPWGNELSGDRCHSSTGVVGVFGRWTTAPVTKYSPRGDSPYGAAGMSGNAWEWCHSLFRPYPYRAHDGREDPDGAGERVLRGGTYLRSDWYVRCAARYRRHPTELLRDGGFRLALTP